MGAPKTCLILGAGASKPYGYPLGSELKENIIEYCRCLPPDCASREKLPATLARLEAFAWRFKKEIKSTTIDHFLSTLDSENPEEHELKEHGKMALAAVLGACEDPNTQVRDWYEPLADTLRRYNAENPLSIVTFNYDRSLEFLVSKKLGRDRQRDTTELSAVCRIKHVYGILANLPGTNNGFEVAYGQLRQQGWHSWKAREALQFIWDEPSKKTLQICSDWIKEAEYVVILGFGYDERNMQRLGLTNLPAEKYVFSTGYNMSPDDRARVRTSCPRASIFWGDGNDDARSFLEKTKILEWATQGRPAADLMRHLATP